jgi:hypothetical protein
MTSVIEGKKQQSYVGLPVERFALYQGTILVVP